MYSTQINYKIMRTLYGAIQYVIILQKLNAVPSRTVQQECKFPKLNTELYCTLHPGRCIDRVVTIV